MNICDECGTEITSENKVPDGTRTTGNLMRNGVPLNIGDTLVLCKKCLSLPDNKRKHIKLLTKQIKAGLIGGPGSGKSTQCAHFFATVKTKLIQIEQIQEWVREAFNNDMIPENNPWVQFWILEEQRRREDSVPKDVRYVVTDSPTILSYVYALQTGSFEKDMWLFVKMYEKFLKDLHRYDYIFFCNREKPYQRDGTRKQSEDEAKQIDVQIRNLLDMHRCKYYVITGTTEERTEQMCKIMELC